jgi:hypothetical protein
MCDADGAELPEIVEDNFFPGPALNRATAIAEQD